LEKILADYLKLYLMDNSFEHLDPYESSPK